MRVEQVAKNAEVEKVARQDRSFFGFYSERWRILNILTVFI